MKLFIILSFALLIFSGFALATPVSSFATNNNNNNNYTHFLANWKLWPIFNNHNNKDNSKKDNNNKDNNKNNNNHNDNNKNKPKDDNDCGKHPEKGECHVNVPEFGAIPGAIALVSSGGTFLYFKKRYN
jgi:hypothetical protein